MWKSFQSNWQCVIILLATSVITLTEIMHAPLSTGKISSTKDSLWVAPSLYYDDVSGEERELISYGQQLIANTSRYLGPNGTVAHISNGMNCQNCHLNAGKKNWGNNYSGVYSTYPRYRDRSGTIETIYKRVSDCLERSLNGTTLDSNSREFKAIYTYIKWIGKDVKKDVKPMGSGIPKLPFMQRAADAAKGKIVYVSQCSSCHGANGEGAVNTNGFGYIYPPLWGQGSYNVGAGLFRISNFAGYVKSNMPFEQASHQNPKLSTEEAWDVAAFVNSQPRPQKDFAKDWPDISKKPFDHPFGPYTDGFDENQHKYGPYAPILLKREEMAKNNSTLSPLKK
ncbi:MAG TPA: c-type cytochrome [Chitinophagaceae bacterium]